MRHRGPTQALSIGLLTATMCPLPCLRCLVALSSGLCLCSAAAFSASFAAIALATITTGADGEYSPTRGLAAVAGPKAFNVAMRRFRRHSSTVPENMMIEEGFAPAARMMSLVSTSAKCQKTTFSDDR